MSARILRHQKHDAALLREGAYIILFVLTKSGNTYEQPGISKRWGRLCALVSFSVGVMQSEVRERWCEPTLRHSCAPTNTHTYTHTHPLPLSFYHTTFVLGLSQASFCPLNILHLYCEEDKHTHPI